MAPNSSSVCNNVPSDSTTTATASPTSEPTNVVVPPSSSTSTLPSSQVRTNETTATISQELKKKKNSECNSSTGITTTSTTSALACVVPLKMDAQPQPKLTPLVLKSCLKRTSSIPPASTTNATVIEKIMPVAEPLITIPVQKNKRRCWECKCKIGLTAVTCKCGFTFCNQHRYAEEHKCSFNFRNAAKRKLEEENPRIVPAKISKIN